MKMSEQQKIAAKLGEFDPVAELLKDESDKIASVINNAPDNLDHTDVALLKKAGPWAPSVTEEEAMALKGKGVSDEHIGDVGASRSNVLTNSLLGAMGGSVVGSGLGGLTGNAGVAGGLGTVGALAGTYLLPHLMRQRARRKAIEMAGGGGDPTKEAGVMDSLRHSAANAADAAATGAGRLSAASKVQSKQDTGAGKTSRGNILKDVSTNLHAAKGSLKNKAISLRSKAGADTTKEAMPPMGAPGPAAGGGAPQMMGGAMPQMGGGMPPQGMPPMGAPGPAAGGGVDPQAAAAAAMDEAALAQSDPIEHENETLRKMIENKKLKLELIELGNQVPGGTSAEAMGGGAAGPAGAGAPQGDPMEYMRQALSQ